MAFNFNLSSLLMVDSNAMLSKVLACGIAFEHKVLIWDLIIENDPYFVCNSLDKCVYGHPIHVVRAFQGDLSGEVDRVRIVSERSNDYHELGQTRS